MEGSVARALQFSEVRITKLVQSVRSQKALFLEGVSHEGYYFQREDQKRGVQLCEVGTKE